MYDYNISESKIICTEKHISQCVQLTALRQDTSLYSSTS
jgi:hypothetical protein